MKKIKLHPEVKAIFEKQRQLFYEMYDRSLDYDSENPYIFWHIAPLHNDYIWPLSNAMRSANIEEAKIYASCRSGLIPTHQNIKFMSDADKEEFDSYYDEFNEAIKSKPQKGKISRLLFVQTANLALNSHIKERQLHICLALHDFILRHLSNKKDFQSYSISNEIDFIGFSMLKLRKDLEALELLEKEHISENMFPVCRSIYETYIYLSAIRNHKGFFEKYILSQAPLIRKGKKYSDLIFDFTKTKRPNLKYYAGKSPFAMDKEIFDCFYNSACQFVHLDPFSAKGYFHGSDPYDEIDPCLTIYVIGLALSVFALFEISNMTFCDKQLRKDFEHLVGGIKQELLICFLFLQGDPFYNNKIFNAFEARLNEINIESPHDSSLSQDELEKNMENLKITDKLPQKYAEMLTQLYLDFMIMYGRGLLKTEEEYAYSLLFYNLDDYNQCVINEMRRNKEDEAKIFAYYATGYFINHHNNSKETEETKDTKEAYRLFQSMLLEKSPSKPVQRIKTILKANIEMNDIIDKNINYIKCTVGDFIRRHLESNQDFLNYEIKTEIDFVGFCLRKLGKDLDTLSVLHRECMDENMFSIARSIFDMYLYFANINANRDFFKEEILQTIANSPVHFEKDSNGVIKYNSLVFDIKYLKNRSSKKKLAERTLFSDDIFLYQVFYGALSQFVHLSPLAAQSYFGKSDPYDDVDADIIAFTLAIFCSTILLEQCTDINGIKPGYRNDLLTLIQKIRDDLVKAYEIFKMLEPSNTAFSHILNRLRNSNSKL